MRGFVQLYMNVRRRLISYMAVTLDQLSKQKLLLIFVKVFFNYAIRHVSANIIMIISAKIL